MQDLNGWLKAIGNEVKKIRGDEKQEAFGDRVGLSRQELSIIENGSRSYGIESLFKILIATKVKPTWLINILAEHAKRDEECHRKLQELLDAPDPWPTVAEYNIHSVFMNYEDKMKKKKT